jgi:tetratricopeptide (TPR) repeat protein
MSYHFAFVHELKYARRLAAIVLLIFCAVGMHAQAVANGATVNGATINGATISGATISGATVNGATVSGTVRDSRGTAIAGADIQLQRKDRSESIRVQTDARGGYSFTALGEGIYTLRVEMDGYSEGVQPPFFLGAKEIRKLDVTLEPRSELAASAAKSAAVKVPAFFDDSQFTVAGVTDTTNLGGHGSGTVVRTREWLAKDTVSLASTGTPPLVPSDAPADPEAEKKLREEVERDPSNFEGNHRLGVFLIETSRAREAVPYLEHAAALAPADYENAYDLARANADAGNDDRARENVKTLLARREQPELHHLLAGIDEKLGNSLEAVHEYQRAAELDAREAYVFDWGSELLLHHAPEPAREVFQQGNRLFPRSERMLMGLGAALFAWGSYDQAVERICEASDLNPSDPGPYIFLGRMLKAQSAPSSALLGKLHRFVTLQPQNAEANYYYAVGLLKRRKSPADTANLAEIQARLNRAIEIDPAFADAHLQLGMLRAEQKNYPTAISEYEQAIHSDAQLEEAHYRLAQLYRQTGEKDKARSELKIYDWMSRKSAEKEERERHEIPQFVYTLRERPQTP